MAPTPDGTRVTPENVQKELQRDELKSYTKEELMMLAEAKDEEKSEASDSKESKDDSKESKETFVKSLEFEPDTFKIDSTGWYEISEFDKNDDIFGKFLGKAPKVKVNHTGDVVEYLEGPAKGEQIFITYQALIREISKAKDYKYTKDEIEAKYLLTADELEQKMHDIPSHSEEYKSFFNQEIKGHLAGYWDLDDKRFYHIGKGSGVWLASGPNAHFDENGWGRDDGDDYRDFGFSGRLLKN